MRVYHPAPGDSLPLIVYVHGGGWVTGDLDVVDGPCRRLALGTQSVVVSIDYRLATGTEAPGVAAARIIGDVDRAIRYAIANADSLQLGMVKLVLSGASAGGHLTLMEALTANAGTDIYIDPTLPAELRAVTVRFDGIVPFVAPTDIATFAQAGGLAPAAEEALLGCTTLSAVALPGSPLCPDMKLAESLSPITLTRAAAADASIQIGLHDGELLRLADMRGYAADDGGDAAERKAAQAKAQACRNTAAKPAAARHCLSARLDTASRGSAYRACVIEGGIQHSTAERWRPTTAPRTALCWDHLRPGRRGNCASTEPQTGQKGEHLALGARGLHWV
jgi:acetyl esterase/lipase